jgi:hypothetical protein
MLQIFQVPDVAIRRLIRDCYRDRVGFHREDILELEKVAVALASRLPKRLRHEHRTRHAYLGQQRIKLICGLNCDSIGAIWAAESEDHDARA